MTTPQRFPSTFKKFCANIKYCLIRYKERSKPRMETKKMKCEILRQIIIIKNYIIKERKSIYDDNWGNEKIVLLLHTIIYWNFYLKKQWKIIKNIYNSTQLLNFMYMQFWHEHWCKVFKNINPISCTKSN